MSATIKVERYCDKDGLPSCAKDFVEGLVCEYYRTQRFGGNETCLFAPDSGKYTATMERRKRGEGTLIPGEWCPVWKKEGSE